MKNNATSDLAFQRLSALPHPVLWVIAARMKTLSLSLVPVATGTWAAAALTGWSLWVMLASMAAAALIQIGTNLWNDASDGISGADGKARLGPARMTGLGLLDPEKVRFGAGLAFAGACALGLWLSLIGGPWIIGIGLVSLALGYFYSMGPRPLSHTPAGEVLVVAFFGLVAVAGTVLLQTQAVGLSQAQALATALRAPVLGLGLITGLPAAAVLLLNNHRDRAQDRLSGRRTLAILLGENGSRTLYGLLLAASWLGAAGWSLACSGSPVALLPSALLGGVLAMTMARTPISARLNRLIAGTASFQVLLLAGLVLSLGQCL